MDESAPLLATRAPVDAEAVRWTALLYMVCSSFIFGSFLALREDYTTKVLHSPDPVATATAGVVAFYLGHGLTSPILGKLSDGTGRKPIIIMGVTTTIACYAMLAVLPSAQLFVICFGVLGLFDSSSTMIYLMLVDTSNAPLDPGIVGVAARAAGLGDESRTLSEVDAPVERRIGLLFSFCWGFGLFGSILGVVSALIFSSVSGIRGTIAADAGLAFLLLCRVIFGLPETVDGSDVALGDLVLATLSEQRQGMAIVFGSPRRRALLAASFLSHAASAASFSLLAYWSVFKFGFGLGLQSVGILIAVCSVAAGVASLQLWLVPYVKGDADDTKRPAEVACVCLIGVCLPFWILLGVAMEPWMGLVGLVATACSAVFPELRALLTSDLHVNLQGFVQGFLATVNSLADIAGAVVGIVFYEFGVDDDVPHDSHRARVSVRANGVWHLVFLLQLAVAIILFLVPAGDTSASAVLPADAKKPPVATPLLDDEEPVGGKK